ncbi:MAG: DUF1801 domain-containing protein [SAR202 cluster bacterium]|nr:DUF1801 domain-containing protein [SAR202 cluster bacterium]MDP7412482.1 DUF1801 domain-containing protein [SAR202 cluster bacterium]
MAQSKAATVDQYLDELKSDRRDAISAVRRVVLDNLPDKYREIMQFGMISYVIPLEDYPETYNGQALGVAALSSQKRYMSLYLMNVYGDPEIEDWFRERYRASGKKLDMGKACVRFKTLDNLPLDLVAETIALTPPAAFIERYEESRRNMASARRARR